MDPQAHRRFAELVEPQLPALRAFVDRRDPSLTDDVLSEVGVVAWRRIGELPPGRERAWLFGVTRHVLLAERRKRAQHAATRAGVEPNELADPALDPVLAPGVHRPLAQALARLSERDRDLLLLTAWEGLSTAEAATALGVRPAAARMGLVRARRRLAAALDELDPGWTGSASPDGTAAAPSAAARPHTPSPSPARPDADEEVGPCAAAS